MRCRAVLFAIAALLPRVAQGDDSSPPPFNIAAAEAAVRYELGAVRGRLKDQPLLCLAAGDGSFLVSWNEPPAELVARLADVRPAIKPFGQCPMPQRGTPVDAATGKAGTLVTVWSTKCRDDSHCDVQISIGPYGYGDLDSVVKSADGWSVSTAASTYIDRPPPEHTR
jgi:hypothetical protein